MPVRILVTSLILLSAAAPASSAVPQTVLVVAGKPLEFQFVLSKTVVPVGRILFEVRNEGRLPHRFKVCAREGLMNAHYCAGRETKWIAPGASARLVVFFPRPGRFEYLCGVRGHAAAGMKGTLRVVSRRRMLAAAAATR